VTKPITNLQLAIGQPEVFEGILNDALMHTDDENAGAVLLVTRQSETDPSGVEVLLVFPTENEYRTAYKYWEGTEYEHAEPLYRPTGIVFGLNTFLNAARKLAEVHGARIQPEESDAYTHDMAAQILLDPKRGKA